MISLRPATRRDDDAIWPILHAVIAAGDTFVQDPGMSREDALAYWFRADTHTYVAERGGEVVGSYVVRPNQPALGDHMANAAYIVSPAARGLGIGRLMGEHSLAEARRLGFRAMQFNFVISTNTPAVRLWQKLGFKIIGTVPAAYRHAQLGLVDIHIMHRSLAAAG